MYRVYRFTRFWAQMEAHSNATPTNMFEAKLDAWDVQRWDFDQGVSLYFGVYWRDSKPNLPCRVVAV